MFHAACAPHMRDSHRGHKNSCHRWPRHEMVVTSTCAYDSSRGPAGAVGCRYHAASSTLGPQQTCALACRYAARHGRKRPPTTTLEPLQGLHQYDPPNRTSFRN